MKSSTDYKNMALSSLDGYWSKAAIATLIFFILMELLGYSPSFIMDPTPGLVLQGLISIVLLPLFWGYITFFLRLIRQEDLGYSHLFDGFSDYFRILFAELLKGIYTILWTMLFIIPGLIKSYSYAMTEFILKDHPDISGEEAICQSIRLMKGHKMDLFMIDLSMIGWLILSFLTLGIGFLFLLPYNYSAHAHFYEDLKLEIRN